MNSPLLEIRNLDACFGHGPDAVHAVDDVSFSLNRDQTFVLLGESGSGKSVTALSIMRLLPATAGLAGKVLLEGRDLLVLSESEMRRIRGNRIAMIFQEPQTSLNPVLTAGEQIGETLERHQGLTGRKQRQRAIELLDEVGIPDPARRWRDYPHQFSGGMKQRIMIAMALAGRPEILIADEPTTALDVTIQARILDLLRELQRETGMAILFITHDIGVAAGVADHIAVMRDGKIVEQNSREAFFTTPKHAYTRQLLDALPSRERRIREAAEVPHHHVDDKVLLEVENLKVHFPIRKGLFKRISDHVRAVDEVSIRIHAGETVAMVGESGSGKTTLGKGILQLLKPTGGKVMFNGEELTRLDAGDMRSHRRDIQVVFQDPYSSMNPRMRIADIIQEGMLALKVGGDRKQRLARVDELLRQVGLNPEHKMRYPHEFSGGQRQRICIARALAVNPRLIICDEPTSALDVSVQAQILDLLRDLQRRLKLAYLFITHNIAVVEYIAHYVAVMYEGHIVEHGPVDDVLLNPQHDYTRQLLGAVPRMPAFGEEGQS